ncbi:glycosyltransferase family 2 protein [Herpetosiphon llansteffanensis]|uniref:glycosyltransferase family 2 protein n=1 Tax=Herpetosiphon llansteffanensis TaxID=2094568 RepID=UPI000D7C70E4|nr:glycosyltransferase family 2 protein [Herpetosiphon llansteffanensis]
MLLSVAIIARDEQRHIGAALASIANLADEIVVLLDPRTSDRTAEICTQAGARVIDAPFESFPAQRNRALAECEGQWVLFLDADERVTPSLQHEIRQLLPSQPSHAGYWIPRFNRYWGRALRGGGWYPDRQLRLLQRSKAQYDPSRLVHELVILAGSEGQLTQHLEHINIESWAELREKQQRYAQAEAATLYRNGVRVKPQNYLLQPLRAIWRRYVTWGGYRDGLLGMLLALVMGWYEFKMYLALAKHWR